MALPSPILLVRHGHDNHETGELSGAGIDHAKNALLRLKSKNIGRHALILTSRATRARQTAGLLSVWLSCGLMTGSTEFTRYGSLPAGLESLDSLLGAELAAHNIDTKEIEGLVVVTHAPLIAAAQGFGPSMNYDIAAPYGSVTEYVPGTWVDPAKQNHSNRA